MYIHVSHTQECHIRSTLRSVSLVHVCIAMELGYWRGQHCLKMEVGWAGMAWPLLGIAR